MSKAKQTAQPSFEDAMQELEDLVSEMESGDLPLEQALAKFERGVVLARASQKMLKEAEQRVQILTNQDGEEKLAPLEQETDL
ncbi:exodeoxyribonuclease VII small subunit [Aliiglaciecola sp. LCG003]|uniref:exodeoxyribonuclease VII small subunit n=1 Tax=Aliiglaciecola sp. LCG003 TaxID=3053655 RepID=UPI002573C148|nr:exodeoxyribonuclease VII small subunit [Aliiglaciecola sp. LCG003]WJG08411.1 exodeoxyribonuclease VII small subunit [Aliiglaciecola sp. LCG003]